MMDNKQQLSLARGFTLIEVLIAILVLSVGLVSIAKFHGHLMQSNHYAKARSLALLLAQEKIAELRNIHSKENLPTLHVPATGKTAVQNKHSLLEREPNMVYSGIEFLREWTLQAYCYSHASKQQLPCADNTMRSDYTHVQVSVSWEDANGNPYQEQLESLLLPPTPIRSLLSVTPAKPQ